MSAAMQGAARPKRSSTVRFAVGTPAGPRAGVWRLWTKGSDVYFGARRITGEVKISLHASGDWRYAFTTEHVQGSAPLLPPGRDRVLDRWRPPPEFAPGLTRVLQLVVPASEVVPVTGPEPKAARIVWVPSAPPGLASYFTLLYMAPDTPCSGWPGRRAMGTRLVWRTVLDNEASTVVWLLVHDAPLPEELRQGLERYRSAAHQALRRTRPELAGGHADIRATISGSEDETGVRVFVDLAIAGPEQTDSDRARSSAPASAGPAGTSTPQGSPSMSPP